MEIQKRDFLTSISEIEKAAGWLAKSRMYGVKSVEEGAIMILTAKEEGITLLEFSRRYHIIDGRVTMRADAMLAAFNRAGGVHRITTYTDKKVEVELTWKGDSSIWSWDWEKATRAGLAGKKNWQAWPESMLFSRCVSEALKRICPEIFHGLYVPEEIQDLTPECDVKAPAKHVKESFTARDVQPVEAEATALSKAWTASDDTLYEAGTELSRISPNHLKELKKLAFAIGGQSQKYEVICQALEALETRKEADSLDIEGLVSKFDQARKAESKKFWSDQIVSRLKITKENHTWALGVLERIEEHTTQFGALTDLKDQCYEYDTKIVIDTKGEKK